MLDLANAFLELLNTPVGTFATQVGLLTAAFFGAQGLIEASKIIPVLMGASAEATVAFGTALKGLGVAVKTAFPILLLAFGIIEGGIAIFDALTVSSEELQESIDNTTQKLSELEAEKQEILSKDDLTAQDQARLKVLEAEIEANDRLLKQEQQKQYARSYGSAADRGYSTLVDSGASITGVGKAVGESVGGGYKEIDNAIDEYERFNDIIERQTELINNLDENSATYYEDLQAHQKVIDDAKERQNELAQTIFDNNEELQNFLEVLGEDAPPEIQEWLDKIAEWAEANFDVEDSTESAKIGVEKFNSSIEDSIATAQEIIGNVQNLQGSLNNLQQAYQTANSIVTEYNQTGQINFSTLASLLELGYDYYDALVMENGQLSLNNGVFLTRAEMLKQDAKETLIAQTQSRIYSVAMQDLGISIEGTGETADGQVKNVDAFREALQRLADGEIDASIATNVLWASLNPEEFGNKTFSEKARKEINDIYASFEDMYAAIENSSITMPTIKTTGSTYTTDQIKETEKQLTEEEKKAQEIENQADYYDELNKQTEFNIWLRKQQGASEEELIALNKEYQNQLHSQAEWFRGEGLDDNSEYVQECIKGWWKLEDENKDLNQDMIDNDRDAFDDRLQISEDYIDERNDLNDWGADSEIAALQRVLDWMDEWYAQGLIDYEYYWEKRTEIAKRKSQAEKEVLQNAFQEASDMFQEQKDTLDDDIDKIINLVVDRIDRHIAELEDELDNINNYYNTQIELVQKANEELDEQIQKEQLLDNIAKARQQKVMVYKDGKWQYVQDIDAVSEAEKALEDYERDEAMEDEIERLEKLRDEAVRAIQAQIDDWQDYRDEWSNLVSDYEKEQDRLYLLQKYGIDLEQDNWQDRLGNLRDFVDDYLVELERLEEAQDKINDYNDKWNDTKNDLEDALEGALGGGGSSSGSGYHNSYDSPSKNTIVNAIDEAMASNSEKWHSASSEEKKQLEQANKDLAAQRDKITGGTSTFNPGTGKWTKNAAGTLSSPGGLSLVGEEGPELRVLGRGDGILPADITANLWKWGEMTPAKLIQSFSGLGSFDGGRYASITIQNLNLPQVKDGPGFVEYMKNNFFQRTVQLEAMAF